MHRKEDKPFLENPLRKYFSAQASREVIVEMIVNSGCKNIIDKDVLRITVSGYLKISSLLDEINIRYINSETMIYLYAHLQRYLFMLGNDGFIVSRFTIDNLLAPVFLVASKISTDEAVRAKDMTRICNQFGIPMLKLSQLILLEADYLNKIQYELAVSTIKACEIYSLMKQFESQTPDTFWGSFFNSYNACFQETKAIGHYEDYFNKNEQYGLARY